MSTAQKEFKNKNYLLIGAANGLGKATACKLAESGAVLFLADIDPKLNALCKILNKKTKCTSHVCDLLDYDKAADGLIRMMGKEAIDGVVYFTRGREKYSFAQLNKKKWQGDFRLSVESAMFIIHRLWTKKKIRKNASIVFLSSVCARLTGSESLAYHMAKSALESMCRYLAVEMGPANIRVNTLELGFLIKDEHKEKFYSKNNEKYRFWAERMQPLRRVSHCEDIIGPIKFFLSQDSSFITGQVLCVDGGSTIQEQSKLVRDFVKAQKENL